MTEPCVQYPETPIWIDSSFRGYSDSSLFVIVVFHHVSHAFNLPGTVLHISISYPDLILYLCRYIFLHFYFVDLPFSILCF